MNSAGCVNMTVQQEQLDQMHGVRDRQLRRQRLEVLANEIDPLNEPVPSPRPYRGMMKAARKTYTYGAARQYPQFFDVPAKEPPNPTYEKYRKEFAGRKVIAHTYNGTMHCEHLAAYYASRPRLKDIRYDAFNKMAREYRKASRDADYAATFWRADNVR